MQLDFEFKAKDNKKYKFNGIQNSAVYTNELAGQLLKLYYLVSCKGYPK